jgi:hypothetical protein
MDPATRTEPSDSWREERRRFLKQIATGVPRRSNDNDSPKRDLALAAAAAAAVCCPAEAAMRAPERVAAASAVYDAPIAPEGPAVLRRIAQPNLLDSHVRWPSAKGGPD